MKRYCKGQPIDFPPSRWFHYFSREDWNGEWYDGFLLRLPSWGYGWDIRWDAQRWGQRVLHWHGKRSFSIIWDFPPESPISVTPDIHGLDR